MTCAPPRVSVVVYVREEPALALPTLRSLAAQEGVDDAEILVADCLTDDAGAGLLREFPTFRRVRAPGAGMPEGKAAALRAATGDVVAILDARDLAEPGWIAAVRRAFAVDDPPAAVGGVVLPDGAATAANGAAYLFEYGAFVPSVAEGPTDGDLPGNCVAYDAARLRAAASDVLARGFWKPFCHARLRAAGGRLELRRDLVVRHATAHRLGDFGRRRFHYGRCFGAMRVKEMPPGRRLLLRVFGPAIPLLLAWRLVRRSLGDATSRRVLARAWAALLVVCFCWGVGECLGAWFGARGSCAKVW